VGVLKGGHPLRRIDYASELSQDQRRREVAAILADGILRLRQLRFRCGDPVASETSPESSARPLAISGETVLSVHTG
jgi:hypothetical protein